MSYNLVRVGSLNSFEQFATSFLLNRLRGQCAHTSGKGAQNWLDKVVLLTGASSGMGKATAITFARLGANVAISGLEVDQLKATAAECKRVACSGNEVLQVPGDVSSAGDIKRIMCATLDKFKRLDILVNAAGIMEMGSIENTSLEQFDRTININLRSMYYLTMLAAPELIKTKGNIVNFSSVCGLRSFPNILAYNISKSGVDQLTKSVALELGPKGVRCNSVNPGVIVTNLQKAGGMDEKAYEEFLERGKQTHALGRVGQVDEVAIVVVFLASDAASFITGVNLSVDGGRHAMCPR